MLFALMLYFLFNLNFFSNSFTFGIWWDFKWDKCRCIML